MRSSKLCFERLSRVWYSLIANLLSILDFKGMVICRSFPPRIFKSAPLDMFKQPFNSIQTLLLSYNVLYCIPTDTRYTFPINIQNKINIMAIKCFVFTLAI